MADKVTFDGVTLMEDGEGHFSFSPGVFMPVGRDFVPLARGDVLLLRELATVGCQHTVELRFKAIANPKAIETRMRTAWSRGLGTLVVRGYGSYTNCAMASPPVMGPGSRSSAADGSTAGVAFTMSVVFMQVA